MLAASKTIKSEKRDSSSLFSTLSMYLMGGGIGDGSREDSEAAEDETNMKKARQVIKDIDIENMFRESKFYGESSLVALLEALRDVSISLLQKNSKRTIPVILCLELMVEVCLQNRDRILIFWPIIMESIEGLLDKRSRSINLIDRLVVNLLYQCPLG